MSEFVIETNGLSRDYGSFRALDKVNLSIEKDKIIALLGPNGAGKTTLLHLLMGMLEPTEGQASISGIDSRTLDNQTVAKIGYMGDGDEPPRWMTARQLINLQAGSSKQFDKAFVKKLLSDKQLSLNKAFGSMSKGQKKWLRAGLVAGCKKPYWGPFCLSRPQKPSGFARIGKVSQDLFEFQFERLLKASFVFPGYPVAARFSHFQVLP